ncbi:MAG: hypothetical protein JWR69_1993, partial [Pedosphaera sp.]|nr:hypothetical protein [Pedosphaera sp.]
MNKNPMNQKRNVLWQMTFTAVGILTFIQAADALPFVLHPSDLCLGFRKVGTFKENNEVVVNIGQATNYVNLASGSVITVTNLSASQLSPDSFTSLNNLSVSAFGVVNGNVYPGYPRNTIWVAIPRSDVNVQSTPPDRQDQDFSATLVSSINNIINGAVAISSRISSNQDNTISFLREPSSNFNIALGQNLGACIGSTVDPNIGNFQDSLPVNGENATAGSFLNAIRSDLYELRPTGFVDPHTGQTAGPGYYVGYFQFNPAGSLTFTRASTNNVPPAPVLSISRNGSANTISFVSTNNVNYKLYLTNSTGLSTATTNCPSLPATITGDNTTKSFLDTTTDADRFYRVKA